MRYEHALCCVWGVFHLCQGLPLVINWRICALRHGGGAMVQQNSSRRGDCTRGPPRLGQSQAGSQHLAGPEGFRHPASHGRHGHVADNARPQRVQDREQDEGKRKEAF
ncbi:hypothetical protein B0T24DRAFT_639989 [Lasiosphaeria ovina]|uniref:Secreted protein n=1 Tax=Lasiosphaeria ovina TaxID=92902 RepID=A0AAE0JWI4_9PEZI|nr:hypothetical protein B0T24DRAFT_639989 [Lasiosphaeria ovina]